MSHVRREFSLVPRRLRGSLLAGFIASLPAAAAAQTTVTVSDTEAEAGDSSLSFTVTRSGDTAEGVRVLVETAPGGPSPATPGQDYTPLPAGTEVTIDPGETRATVEVEVNGAALEADRSLVLRVTEAQAFSPAPIYASAGLTFPIDGGYPAVLVATDLDGDGHRDLVIGNDLSLSISVLLADGAGGFADPVTYPINDPAVFIYSVALAVADVNGDGALDVVAAGFNPALAYLFAGDGAGGLAEPTTIALDGAEPANDIALADVDGDGAADLVAVQASGVSVLRNDGLGGFASAERFDAGLGPIAVAVADVNGDGLADIVTGNSGGGDFGGGVDGDASVLLGEGGSFAPAVSVDLGTDVRPVSLVVGDVDADGSLDIVTANRLQSNFTGPGSVSIATGDGAGGFAKPVQVSLSQGEGGLVDDPPGLAAIGDVNADGRVDIAVTLAIGNAVAILAGQEKGGFADPVRVPVAKGPLPLAIADVTGDDNADIVTGNALDDSVSILPGNGAGLVGFEGTAEAGEYPHSIVAADFDGDGLNDVATANLMSSDVSVLLADGAGGLLHAADYPVNGFPAGITAGDFNGDDAIDLVSANGSGTVSLLLGDGAGGFAEAVHLEAGAQESPYAVAVGDLDEDGNLDLISANQNVANDGVTVFLGDGAGGFAEPAVYEVSIAQLNDPRGLAVADATGDGHLDVVTANTLTGLSLLAGDGAGRFSPPVSIPAGLGPVAVEVVDVNADGRADLVALDHPGQAVSILLGDGTGEFAQPVQYPIFEGPSDQCTYDISLPCPWAWGMAVGDDDGDGDLDIVTANTNTDTVSILSNDGNGRFSIPQLYYTGAHPGSLVVADVTGDGNPDVVTANRENHNVVVLPSHLGQVEIGDSEAVGVIAAGDPDEDSDDGCGCAARGPASGLGGGLLVLLAAFLALRPTRRPRP